MNRTVTVAEGEAIVGRLATELEAGAEPLSRTYAAEILKSALAKAAGRPSPQAPMVSEKMRLIRKKQTTMIIGPRGTRTRSGARMGAVAFGAEFGSSKTAQFGRRDESGKWLYPAAHQPDPATRQIADDYLGDLLKRVIG